MALARNRFLSHARLLLCFLPFLLAVQACEETRPSTQIVSSITPLSLVAQSLTQDTSISCCTNITKAEGYHQASLSPSQVKNIRGAELLLLVGNEAYAERALSYRPSQANVIELISHTMNAHDHHAGHIHDDIHHGENPASAHPWLNPQRVQGFAARFTEVLKDRYPNEAEKFEDNLQKFNAELEASNAEIAEMLQTLAEKNNQLRLIEMHEVLSEFAPFFGVEISAAIRDESDRAMGSKEFTELARKVSVQPERYCLVAALEDRVEASAMSDRLGVRLITYPLYAPDSSESVSYASYLETIAQRLSDCLIANK